MLSQAGQVLVMQIDNMMVGRVGTTELAAASFANSVFIIGMVFGMGFTFGLTPLVGHAYARGDFKKAGALLKNSLYANLIMGIVLSMVLYGISFLMHLMGQPPQVVEEAIPYYRILVVSFLPFLVFFTIKQFVEGIGNTSIAMFVTIAANIINVALNYVLIFGKMGLPEYGLNGAGYATLVARILMPVFFIAVFFRKDWLRRYLLLFSKARLNLEKVKALFQVGWPISLQLLLEVSAFALSGVMMGWLGEVPLAAHQIALGLASMTFMIVTGIASGTTIRVSHQYSKKDYYGMHKAVMASVHLMLAFMSLTALSFVFFRGWLPQLYTPNEEVITLAAQLLIMAAVFQIFDGLQVVILGALRGLADVKTAMVQAFFAYIVVNLPLSYLLTFVFNIGPKGIWIGFVAGLAIAAVLFYRRFDKIYRRLALSTQNVRT